MQRGSQMYALGRTITTCEGLSPGLSICPKKKRENPGIRKGEEIVGMRSRRKDNNLLSPLGTGVACPQEIDFKRDMQTLLDQYPATTCIVRSLWGTPECSARSSGRKRPMIDCWTWMAGKSLIPGVTLYVIRGLSIGSRRVFSIPKASSPWGTGGCRGKAFSPTGGFTQAARLELRSMVFPGFRELFSIHLWTI
ncbi:hypothetical protein PCH_Pc13g08360 [Penicillium rubens Wisconsin 54-1255]|uniref:Uncharacterized protein n=1 Tax=Penicillium rubens (strain ATCC 28089 / DSM 1075 / NRRL 1951 / Wisconsin 54-1255) TaxID=500485 RepID=B6H4B9_PENRW|nr:hypothetical protein PCH_Pc13g08360 [Penicillium rubens Wisconsin 54-1255]